MGNNSLGNDPVATGAFAEMLKEDGHDNLSSYLFNQRQFFGDIDLSGRTVLEIGSGRGLTSIYAALAGATAVVSMEPGLAGAKSQVRETQERRIARLGLAQVELLGDDFNTWEAEGRRFDVVVSCSSINHLYESPHHALSHRQTYDRYRTAVSKMHALLNEGGVACVSDACRYSFFQFAKHVGIKRPWDRRRLTVNWRIHQNPRTWRRIFEDAGFSRIDIDYPLPHSLKALGAIVANPVANFFLNGSFVLRAWR